MPFLGLEGTLIFSLYSTFRLRSSKLQSTATLLKLMSGERLVFPTTTQKENVVFFLFARPPLTHDPSVLLPLNLSKGVLFLEFVGNVG